MAVRSSQKRAITNFRSRLDEKGLARFEVTGRSADRELVRALARRLAEDGPEAGQLRAVVTQTMAGPPPTKGNIMRALMASPLVGSEIDLSRSREEGRQADL